MCMVVIAGGVVLNSDIWTKACLTMIIAAWVTEKGSRAMKEILDAAWQRLDLCMLHAAAAVT